MRLIAMWVSLTTLWAGAAPASVKDLDPKAAAELVKENAKNPKFLILDVRTPGEFTEGHIKGAALLDFKAADFREKLAKLSRKKTYLVHCAVGGRSAKAVRAMADLGFQDVYHLKSGFDGWVEAGLPAVK
jgi:rhodanese-related sulfurtransferase